jgi:uncharacterized glyoxalase superfamily protein PhnB
MLRGTNHVAGQLRRADRVSRIHAKSASKAPPTTDRLFAALADGGEVQMPPAKTFFSPRFGMVADRFGVSWMIIVMP